MKLTLFSSLSKAWILSLVLHLICITCLFLASWNPVSHSPQEVYITWIDSEMGMQPEGSSLEKNLDHQTPQAQEKPEKILQHDPELKIPDFPSVKPNASSSLKPTKDVFDLLDGKMPTFEATNTAPALNQDTSSVHTPSSQVKPTNTKAIPVSKPVSEVKQSPGASKTPSLPSKSPLPSSLRDRMREKMNILQKEQSHLHMKHQIHEKLAHAASRQTGNGVGQGSGSGSGAQDQSEMALIRQTIQNAWRLRLPMHILHPEEAILMIELKINAQGKIQTFHFLAEKSNRAHPDFEALWGSIQEALRSPECQTLPWPKTLYNHTICLRFCPSDLG